ncbi:hypothetical protein LEP1GSC145_1605 [Leptospira interrogans serovar Djasiman str. LT1649]|uniref:Uncharacterized protein n=1 Tax=Leptospira interrogans serovar Hardjo str. Norma TaxID=1279460 RepID=A0A0M3TL86_LEPIR|nr:hypothetical protein G436_1454 [Leptospira interrogans serovar Hardjo str. Norma]EJP16962.1 hypothetical protein LEP1GSC080_2402 [Leptospira interrogans str. FPW2026]EKO95869.1 hypothetical protein LEP1GSC057_0924 [Leptospira interrogans str. Brem 329]EKR45242.1 hypothetical protein LEP1GSC097_3267 [Leptospira interrogans serovar Grippotyphosa str. UI 08368]EMF71502.1 hypothetical protein LEP1GSC148_4370 [Leptospira interrogans serovar Canicola str. LT1962]EMJ53756.1 hypothetical protein LE
MVRKMEILIVDYKFYIDQIRIIQLSQRHFTFKNTIFVYFKFYRSFFDFHKSLF